MISVCSRCKSHAIKRTITDNKLYIGTMYDKTKSHNHRRKNKPGSICAKCGTWINAINTYEIQDYKNFDEYSKEMKQVLIKEKLKRS